MKGLPEPGENAQADAPGTPDRPDYAGTDQRVHFLLELEFCHDQPCCDRTPPPRWPPGPLKGPTPAQASVVSAPGNTTGTRRGHYGENCRLCPRHGPC